MISKAGATAEVIISLHHNHCRKALMAGYQAALSPLQPVAIVGTD
jgi:pyrroline-5-carboxylate reductase